MTGFAAPTDAWVRPVSSSFSSALRQHAAPLDVDRARSQHAGYAAALAASGVRVHWLPGDDALPDACFVEDTAVLALGRVAITRPGAGSRRAETAGVRASLGGVELASGTLDGGDVLRTGDRLFVGLSKRTTIEGVTALAALFPELDVVAVPVTEGLHLKSAVTLAAPDLAVFHGVDPGFLAGLRVVEAPEPLGANVLALGGRVLVSASAPKTASLLASLGVDVVAIDVSELHRADGGLTCLSLRAAAPGAWCC